MNFTRFMRQVDTGVAEMSRDMLEQWVHELARTTPEEDREWFLDRMRTISQGDRSPAQPPDDTSQSLDAEIEEVLRALEDIREGNRGLDSEINEEWDDWYNSEKEEFLFSDPGELLPDIERGIDLVHQCIDTEQYRLGWEAAERLSALEVTVTGEYNDYEGEPMGIPDLYRYALLDGSLEAFTREAVFLAYVGNELPDRAQGMYGVMERMQCPGVRLEDIVGLGGEDLPQLREFLPLWVRYLGTRTGWIAEDLLKEALAMLDDDAQALDMARRFVDIHPQMYKQLLEDGLSSGENDRLFQIGMEALAKIPGERTVRSEIALLTARYARRREDTGAVEACCLEAFRSDPSVMNYMRLRLEARDYSQYSSQVTGICNTAWTRTECLRQPARWENPGTNQCMSMSDPVYFTIQFWEKDFDRVWDMAMRVTEPLGWTLTFLKQGLALFSLLLFEGEKLPQGLRSMLNRAVSACGFNGKAYLNGAETDGPREDAELFWKLFRGWKAEVSVPEEKAAQWLKQMESLVSMRVAGIMAANKRNYYGECAGFIAALGETQESRGIKGAKAAIMDSYQREYSRRRAFHQELRAYGMK